MSKGTEPELPQPITPPADHFSIYRELADQLREALGKLDRVEAEIVRVRTEYEGIRTQISGMADADECDMEVLANLGIRQRTYELRLTRLAENQLFNAQSGVQTLTLDLGRRSEILWRQCRSVLLEQALERILEVLHPSARQLQRPFIGTNVAPLADSVVSAEGTCAIELHPNCSDPLSDTIAREFSKQREGTMALVRQEAGILLSKLPALLELASTLTPVGAQPEAAAA
jgi:hypothetical protein